MGCWGITAFESDAGLDAVDLIRHNLPGNGRLELSEIIKAMQQEKWYVPDVSDGRSQTGPMALAEIIVKYLNQDKRGLDYDEEWATEDNKFSSVTSFTADKTSLKWLRRYISDTLEHAKENAVFRAEHATDEWDLRGGWQEEKDWTGWKDHMSALISRLDVLIASQESVIELNWAQEHQAGPSMEMQ